MKIRGKRSRVISALSVMGIAAAGILSVAPTATASPTPTVAMAVKPRPPAVGGKTFRNANNMVVVEVRANRRNVAVFYNAWGKRTVRPLVANRVGVVRLVMPRATSQVAVRVRTVSGSPGTPWKAVKVAPWSDRKPPNPTPSPTPTPTPTPTPSGKTPRVVNIDTCEQFDAFLTPFSRHFDKNQPVPQSLITMFYKDTFDPIDLRVNVDYAKSCGRGSFLLPDRWFQDVPTNPVATLGVPTIKSVRVVPLDNTAPDGWTAEQIRRVYGYDKKGWFVELEYPLNGDQRAFDLDSWWWAFGGSHPRGMKMYTGTHRWFTQERYSPADVGDTVTIESQTADGTPSFSEGMWVWSPLGVGEQYPYWEGKVTFPTQTVVIGSPTTGWKSSVRLTKFISVTGDENGQVDLNAQVPLNVTTSATAFHGKDYLPSTGLTAETLGFDKGRMTEHPPAFYPNGDLQGQDSVLRSSVGGEEKAYMLSMNEFKSAIGAVTATTAPKTK